MSALPKIQPSSSSTLDDKIEILSNVALFSDLKKNEEALRQLAQVMTECTYEEGKHLMKEGEEGKELFILYSGIVSVYKRTPENDPYKVAILSAATHPTIGEGAIVATQSRSATIVCDSKCHLLVFSRKDFLEFGKSNPSWALPIYERIARTLVSRVQKMSTDLTLLHMALTKEIRGN